MADKYGIKKFEKIVDCLWKKRYQLDDDFVFDYPEYGGLPKKVAAHLYSDDVDFLQSIYDTEYMAGIDTKAQFAKELRYHFFPLGRP